MADERASITIRLPKDLLDRIREAAICNSHSANAEIVQCLSREFVPEDQPMSQEDLDDALLDAAETYIIGADDEAVMHLLSKRFVYAAHRYKDRKNKTPK
ncbi:Arc family DNA-binding protein [Acetobacter sp.]|uniref:Arc family DNA-binding protein n=1 Tax=Acetobacter sp. TaxID=440 RepID=UPI0039ECDAF4